MKQVNGRYRHTIGKPTDSAYFVGYGDSEIAAQEYARKAAFRACPILVGFLSCALEDLQHTESDESCMEERTERDSGTIYDCPPDVFEWARTHCAEFLRAQIGNVEAALQHMTWDRIGSTFYMSAVGHGVAFTDDASAPCLEGLETWISERYYPASLDSLYFGDDGKVYSA